MLAPARASGVYGVLSAFGQKLALNCSMRFALPQPQAIAFMKMIEGRLPTI